MTSQEQTAAQADPAVEAVPQTPPPTETKSEREPKIELVGKYKIIGARQLRLYREDQYKDERPGKIGIGEPMYFTDFKFLADFGDGEKPYFVRTTGNFRQFAKDGFVIVYNFHLQVDGKRKPTTDNSVAFIDTTHGIFTLSATFVSEELPDSMGREYKWEMN